MLLASVGLTDQWFLPLLLVVILLGWQVASPRDWRFSPSILVGMILESCILAIALVGHQPADRPGLLVPRPARPARPLGGVTSPARHEPGSPDRLSRCRGLRGDALPPRPGPVLFGLLRLLQTPQVLASALAVTASALALLAGPPRGHARRGLHLVRLRLPLDGRRVLRLGLRASAALASRSARTRRTISWSAGWAGISEPAGLSRLSHSISTANAIHEVKMSPDARPFRLIHVSDIHFWQYAFNPLQLFSKRLLGMASLLVRRARRFRLERVHEVVDRVARLEPDHILITGDLTTTALPAEFRAARGRPSSRWLDDPGKVDDHPGQSRSVHVGAHRDRRFEQFFGEFAPAFRLSLAPLPRRARRRSSGSTPRGPASRPEDGFPTATGTGPGTARPRARPIRRLIVACHYPLDAPLDLSHETWPARA